MPMPTEYLLQFFKLDGLPQHLVEVVEPFAKMAHVLVYQYPANDDRDVAVRKLLEAKDATVRCREATNVPPYGL
jgi:hypothetical protein